MIIFIFELFSFNLRKMTISLHYINMKKMNNNTESCQDLYTVQEINAQPRLWLETFLLLKKNKEEISNYLQPILDINNLRIIVTGAGSSAFIGEAAQSIIQKQTNQLTQPIATTDLVTHPDFFFIKDTPTLLISFAKIRAHVVFPTPLGPQKRRACARLSFFIAFDKVLTIASCPITSSNF